jgi:hypothetical protein
MNDPTYGPFKDNLAKITTGIHLHHFQSTPHPSSLGKAPCTEVATFFKCEDGMLENVEKFAKILDDSQPEGYMSTAFGQVIEKVAKHADVGKENVENSAAVVAFIG